MKDFLGHDLAVGDEVVFMQISYRDLKRGKVVKLTQHFSFILCEGWKEPIKQKHYQIIKIR